MKLWVLRSAFNATGRVYTWLGEQIMIALEKSKK